jgi:urease accessory protein
MSTAAKPAKKMKASVSVYRGITTALRRSVSALLAVKAAPEALIEVTAPSAKQLMRLAWHLGNRHLPAQIEAERILIRDDHVIAAMLAGLGARLRPLQAPFNPERGAYHDSRDHAHGH